MKPLNLDNKPCSPVSSNCVVWQGPTIECLELCTGDTVSDVVAKLATELCTILDQTNVSNYDLSCLNIVDCGPADFKALIQLLIAKICELQNIPTENTESESECPDCVVTIADCFQEDGATTMQLIEYVQIIAEKVCALIDEIAELQLQITNLDIRVTALENAPKDIYTLPSIIVNCTLTDGLVVGGNAYTIDVVLDALVNDDTYGYCALLGATGLPADLLSAVATQCIAGDSLTLDGGVTFSSLGGWINSPMTVADAITNIWLVICDTYNYLNTLNIPITVVTAGDGIDVTSTVVGDTTTYEVSAQVQDTGWVDLLGFDFYSVGTAKPQCRRMGNQIHFRGTVVIPISNGLGGVVDFSGPDYVLVESSVVYDGPGGCTVIPGGAIKFNNSDSIIPASVLPAPTTLDKSLTTNWIVCARQIAGDDGGGSRTSLTLSTVLRPTLDATGVLTIQTIRDVEEGDAGTGTGFGQSHLRYIISDVKTGDKAPYYTSASTNIHNNPTSVVAGLDVDFTTDEYTFNCDGGEPDQIGGFPIQLEGLIAYLDPCTTIESFNCE
jgi:hypothetical protein